jgi:hypothetical protein
MLFRPSQQVQPCRTVQGQGHLEAALERREAGGCRTKLEWAKSMTWKGIKPIVTLSRKTYANGVSQS